VSVCFHYSSYRIGRIRHLHDRTHPHECMVNEHATYRPAKPLRRPIHTQDSSTRVSRSRARSQSRFCLCRRPHPCVLHVSHRHNHIHTSTCKHRESRLRSLHSHASKSPGVSSMRTHGICTYTIYDHIHTRKHKKRVLEVSAEVLCRQLIHPYAYSHMCNHIHTRKHKNEFLKSRLKCFVDNSSIPTHIHICAITYTHASTKTSS
jgi:hypothetical protein